MILIVDTALLVLIWLVQLIIYPVFQYMSTDQLKTWHRIYVPRITAIVAPLMILQLVLSIVNFELEIVAILRVVLLIGIWINTFLQAVPIHGKIFRKTDEEITPAVQRLLRVNWVRTLFWTALWAVNFIHI